MVKTSVIIPIYNTQNYLDECIQSVLNQTQREIEIILVDDGSTDGSRSIIEKYKKKYNNIIAIYQSNQKLGIARNNGIKAAKGKYIYFLDSDDYIAKNLLKECYDECELRKLDFLCFDSESFIETEKGEKIFLEGYDRENVGISDEVLSGKEYWYRYYDKGGIIPCAPFIYIKREFFLNNNLMFQPGVFYEDNDWIVRMYICADRVGYLPQKFYFYRRHRKDSIMSSKYTLEHLNSCVVIIWKLLDMYQKVDKSIEKKMIADIFETIIKRFKNIVENIDSDCNTDSLIKQINMFVNKAWIKKDILSELEKRTYILFLILIVSIKKCFGLKNQDTILLNFEIILKKELCINYMLGEKINIGIYGIGKMCDEIFQWYESNGIDIQANIVFISSDNKNCTYMGYPLYNVTEINSLDLQHIIVASTKYKSEMLENLQRNKIKVDSIFITPGSLV